MDNVTVDYFFEHQEITPSLIKNTQIDMIFLSLTSPNSYCMCNLLDSFTFLVEDPKSIVPFTYFRIIVVALRCISIDFFMYLVIKITSHTKLGLVKVIYIKLTTSCLKYVFSTTFPFQSFDNFILISVGVANGL